MSSPESDSSISDDNWKLPSAVELDRMLPQYEISDILGRGAMGAVFKGRQRSLKRDVAIKVLCKSAIDKNEEVNPIERFIQEAQVMAQFDHPAIVSVHDFGETHDGQFYLVMEFIDGMNIHEYLKQHGGPLSQMHALSITAHVLDGLAYAHSHGIIHRDIKPANILLNQEGRVKIADFGLMKRFGAENATSVGLGTSHFTVGTPFFLAPEAVNPDHELDHRADLYSVGVMLYQMLTGTLPQGNFKAPSVLRPELDVRLDKVVGHAMEPDPENRYNSAAAIRADIDDIVSQPIAQIKAGISDEDVPSSAPAIPMPHAGSITRKAPHVVDENTLRTLRPVLFGAAIAILLITSLVLVIISGNKEKGEPLNSATKDDHQNSAVEPPKMAETTDKISLATKDKPFSNSIGMRFVPVPITGGDSDEKKLLFSIWETRGSDYAQFLRSDPTRTQEKVWFKQQSDHPAVNMTYEDAEKFCLWLTEMERENGVLGKNDVYRLPSDHEWSCAAGIGDKEDATLRPNMKTKGIPDAFAWGTEFPPRQVSGNYGGEEYKDERIAIQKGGWLKDYDDGFVYTSPAGSFQANEFGLYDMGGNVQEWCEGGGREQDITKQTYRGASWNTFEKDDLLLSNRSRGSTNNVALGFRVVLDIREPVSE